ncbi:MAG: creatininase family protein [Thaumarchaeota archaeon]|nr:creatininase family protein [Nitrososphaerota archaeon]
MRPDTNLTQAVNKFNIGEMTWVEVKDAIDSGIDTVVFPVGAIEQHGPHGVFGTDSFCAQVVAEKVARKLNALQAPLMPYGLSSSHMNFKGTISVSQETLTLFAKDVMSSLIHHGFKKIVVINGNEPNFYPFMMVARTLREETGALITVSNWYAAVQEVWKQLPGVKGTEVENWKWSYFMAHGGMLETAGAMAYKPNIVRLDLATTYGSERREAFSNAIVSLPARIDEVTPKGSYGDPRLATEEMGKRWTELAAEKIVEKVKTAWETIGRSP